MHPQQVILLGLATAICGHVYQGFNYGSTNEDGSCRNYEQFKHMFTKAKNLARAPGFTSARLYTSIQCGTQSDPISAYQAAIDTDSSILVGVWTSAGRDVFTNELNSLRTAVTQLGSALTNRIIGISIGSEDLYRNSDPGKAAKAGVGATAAEIEGYIGWARDWFRGTPLESIPLGHVDTWTAWVLPETAGVARAVDFLGHNSFPYFETTREANHINDAADNFWTAVGETERIASGKPVFVTDTGWPHSGPPQKSAVASVDNAQRYWSQVGCALFGKRTTFWYTLVDADSAPTDISFGVTRPGSDLPLYNLAC